MPVWGLDLAAGFSLGFGLILAIGAQNAFVLRQGLRREHVGAVVAACALSDAALIAAGVAGFGTLAAKLPWFAPVMRFGGAAFLIWYGFVSLRSAVRGGQALQAQFQDGSRLSFRQPVTAFHDHVVRIVDQFDQLPQEFHPLRLITSGRRDHRSGPRSRR